MNNVSIFTAADNGTRPPVAAAADDDVDVGGGTQVAPGTVPVAVVTVVMNALVIVAIARTPRLQTNTHRLLANLAAADAAFSLFLIVVSLGDVVVGRHRYGKFGCLMAMAASILITMSSLAGLLLITADRYVAVTRAVRYKTLVTVGRTHAVVALTWSYGVATAATSFGVAMLHWRDEFEAHCYVDWILPAGFVYFLVGNYVVVLLVMVYTYVAILRLSLRRLARVAHQHARGATVAPSPFKSRTTRMTVMIISLAVTCMLPHMVHMVAIHARGSYEPYAALRRIRVVFLLLNSLANPLIYVWQNRQFRAAMLALVCGKSCRLNVGIAPTTHQPTPKPTQGSTQGSTHQPMPQPTPKLTQGSTPGSMQQTASPAR
ncbi:PREDICTED: adenosine receptor A2b-like, partial [Priapulus caudatus]|uniref:Adenosine receptor A2b-like n=1 Tax=Priapulus caudatus TaxID=37621 RepID=A0ABM1F7I7_PRICU